MTNFSTQATILENIEALNFEAIVDDILTDRFPRNSSIHSLTDAEVEALYTSLVDTLHESVAQLTDSVEDAFRADITPATPEGTSIRLEGSVDPFDTVEEVFENGLSSMRARGLSPSGSASPFDVIVIEPTTAPTRLTQADMPSFSSDEQPMVYR